MSADQAASVELVATEPLAMGDDLPSPSPRPTRRRLGTVALWAQVGLAVALLAASAAGRAWQARRVDQLLRDGRVAPFALVDLPMTLGSWTGRDEAMDPIIARATGSTERIQRVYQNAVTGQKVTVLVLFGPSTEMFIHAPEICYPAAGFSPVLGPLARTVTGGKAKSPESPKASWPFHEVVYSKGEGGQANQEEVYYTWRYSGVWTPGLMVQKQFERIPGMFKVQVARRVRDREIDLLDVGNPCEAFLKLLMPEIDRRIVASPGGKKQVASAQP
ncbi:MAG: hypothetical protein JWO68_4116 [Actinomycetia bacterium]|nr:hypothetical protein [Actinomycetes bacterium]